MSFKNKTKLSIDLIDDENSQEGYQKLGIIL